jgi:serine/threonine protein kinase
MSASSTPIAAASVDVGAIVDEFKSTWRNGHVPDTVAAIREYPSILAYRSLVIDLAYEEYCLREEAGATPDAEAFCAALPAYRSHMREVIRGHRELADHPEILAHAPAPWPEAGDTLDGMPLVRELGRGALARVFLATDPGAGGRSVVLKVSQRRSAEANTLGPIDHDHVVGVHWAKEIDGLFVICMPFVAATTLLDAIEATRFTTMPTAATLLNAIDAIDATVAALPTRPAARKPILRATNQSLVAGIVAIATPLANALAFLHRQGICHGDLKPSNILLGPGGVPFLIDFHLASAADASGLRLGGTLPYMAPECICAMLELSTDESTADRADVYSFGAALYECLTGQVPYSPIDSESVRAIAVDLVRKKICAPTSPRKLNPKIPRWLAKLVESCLDLNPARRPSAAKIESELVKRQSRSSKIGRLIAAAVLVVGGVTASQWIAMPSQSINERSIAPSSPAQITDPFERGIAYLQAGQIAPAMIAFSEARQGNPDGQTYAYLGYCHSRTARHDVAVECYLKAVESGFDEAWVHNNRAYSLTQINRNPTTTLPIAMKEVSRAREMAPLQRGIQFNWAYIRFLSKYDSKTKRFKDEECLQALQSVMAEGPYDAELYYKAGMILAAGSDSEENRRQAIAYLTNAVDLGMSPNNLLRDPVLKANLGGRPDFSSLSVLSPGNPSPKRIHLELVNPTE